VRDAGLDAFYIWQETYDPDVYSGLHPGTSPKSDFEWRTGVFDRAIKSGIKKVGLGVLFGLADWKYDLLSLISHGKYLQEEYGVTPDAIGIPRFRSAAGAVLKEAPNAMSDDDLKLAVALYRLAFPHSHVFLNTREKMTLLMELIGCGGSEMNIACAVYPGGYSEPKGDRQFDFYSYPTDKTVARLRDSGYEVSHFAEAVRTGD
jgi:2-iminoacetate synthase